MNNYYIHNLDPIAFNLFGLPMPWYWLVYFLGYFWILWFCNYLYKKKYTDFGGGDLLSFIFPCFFILLLSGKLFYILFYNLNHYLANPAKVFAVWEGGMSFHGALIGCAFWTHLYAKKNGYSFFKISDTVITGVPLVLFFGRMANFINGELAGRVTDMPWAVVFPKFYDQAPRHPSQIYEALLEGILLFIILFLTRKKIKDEGVQSSMFLIGYGLARFFVEFFRMPDPQIGYILNFFTIGQLYCFVMIALGVFFLRKKITTLSFS